MQKLAVYCLLYTSDIYYYPDCETMTDVAYYYIDELQALGDIPPSLQNYIDYEAYGRDLDMGGCFIETSRGTVSYTHLSNYFRDITCIMYNFLPKEIHFFL